MTKRFVERALLGITDNLMIDLGWDSFQNNLRQHDLLLYALAQESGCLLDIRGERAEPRQPIVVVLECLEAQRISQLIRCLDSAELVEGDQVPEILVSFDFILVIFLKKIVIRAVGR